MVTHNITDQKIIGRKITVCENISIFALLTYKGNNLSEASYSFAQDQYRNVQKTGAVEIEHNKTNCAYRVSA